MLNTVQIANSLLTSNPTSMPVSLILITNIESVFPEEFKIATKVEPLMPLQEGRTGGLGV